MVQEHEISYANLTCKIEKTVETKANYIRVGMFTIITVLLACAIGIAISKINLSSNLQQLDVRITGSAPGLSEGALVMFNGIPVGSVKKLYIDKTNPNMIIAETMVNKDTPLTRSSVAMLASKGITGLSYIALEGGDVNEPRLLESARKANMIPRIDAHPYSMDNVLTQAPEILETVKSTVQNLNLLIKEIREPITLTMKNIEKLSDNLNNNMTPEIQQTLANTRKLSATANATLTNLNNMLTSLNKHVTPIATNLQNLSGRSVQGIESLIASITRAIARIERTLDSLERNPQRIIWGGENSSIPRYKGGS